METKQLTGLGDYLRAEREKRHITIEQVASATKINIKLLHALEADNYDVLPAKPFIRGFVTSYTRYLGLDHKDVLSQFEVFLDEKSGKKFKRPEGSPHIFVEREGQTDNSKTMLSFVMLGFLVVAVVVFAVLKPSLKHHHGRGKDKPMTNEELITVVPPPTDGSPILAKPLPADAPTQAVEAPEAVATATPVASTKAEPAPAVPTPTPSKKAVSVAVVAPPPAPVVSAPAPAPVQSSAATAAPVQTTSGFIKLPPIPNDEVKVRLIARAIEDSWVRYQVDDRPTQAYTLRKDKVIFIRARSSIRFTTAKPKAIEISNDNKEFHAFGSTAKVMILPKSAEQEFKTQPFVAPNPTYLSTPDH